MIDHESISDKKMGRWDNCFNHNSLLYDSNNLIVGVVTEDLSNGGFKYLVYSPENKLNDYASGHTDTIEAAKFLIEMLAKLAGWSL